MNQGVLPHPRPKVNNSCSSKNKVTLAEEDHIWYVFVFVNWQISSVMKMYFHIFDSSGSLLLAWQAPPEPFSRPPPMCWLPPASHYYQSDQLSWVVDKTCKGTRTSRSDRNLDLDRPWQTAANILNRRDNETEHSWLEHLSSFWRHPSDSMVVHHRSNEAIVRLQFAPHPPQHYHIVFINIFIVFIIIVWPWWKQPQQCQLLVQSQCKPSCSSSRSEMSCRQRRTRSGSITSNLCNYNSVVTLALQSRAKTRKMKTQRTGFDGNYT